MGGTREQGASRLLVAAAAAIVAVSGTAAAVVATRTGNAGAKRSSAYPARAPDVPPLTATTSAPATSSSASTVLPASPFRSRLDAALGPSPGCAVVNDGPTAVYQRDATQSFAPASTQKLLVAAAALAILGPDHRLTTTVVSTAAPHDGSVGGLWLVGGGDALLASPEFAAHVAKDAPADGLPLTPLATLADALTATGIRLIAGPVHGDASRYHDAPFLPSWSPTYRVEQDVGVLSALTLNEGIQQWKPTSKLTPDPAAFAASELGRLLVGRGVAVGGPSDDQAAPAGAVVLAQVTSAPLSEIVSAMLRASDNLIAELLVRELDRHAGGAGTTAGGLHIVVQKDAQLGLPLSGVHLVDGSGLDAGDRATCAALLASMDLGARPGFQAITAGLAVAGVSGTLVHRFVGTALAGHLAAKTGWIDNVAGMVGRLQLPGRPAIRFALLVNQPLRYVDALAIENRFVNALATYPGG
jgi:D-alanyl-D-alanine carboxypeptidase/D-alanyl-D-alanine-endopeptidase (penicillin-binding protein 4)